MHFFTFTHVCQIFLLIPCVWCTLKVPKHEIFDRSDFPDFYTIKYLRVGDFGVKIKKNFTNI
jgi:hypothetical protein